LTVLPVGRAAVRTRSRRRLPSELARFVTRPARYAFHPPLRAIEVDGVTAELGKGALGEGCVIS